MKGDRSAFRPIILRYADGTEETGVELDAETVEAAADSLSLKVGDVIEVDGVPRRVLRIFPGPGVRIHLATGDDTARWAP